MVDRMPETGLVDQKMMKTKHCSSCKSDLPLESFSIHKRTIDGRNYRCRACIRSYRQSKGITTHNPPPGSVSLVVDGKKKCTKCNFNLPVSCFTPRKRGFDGLNGWCKNCFQNYCVERGDHKKRIFEVRPARNVEIESFGLRECFGCRRALKPEEFDKSGNKNGYLMMRCKGCIILKNRARMTPEKTKAYREKAKKNDPLYFEKRCKYTHERNAREKSVDTGEVTLEILASLYSQEICTYCKKFVPRELRAVDHIEPLTKGGVHHPDNLTMSCKSCNSRKRNMELERFIERQKLLENHPAITEAPKPEWWGKK